MSPVLATALVWVAFVVTVLLAAYGIRWAFICCDWPWAPSHGELAKRQARALLRQATRQLIRRRFVRAVRNFFNYRRNT